uniref:Uncharacterized protein n=1 Tax=Sphaerodactylus townsendi TaxID=933632 RepID=A0ACB8FB86_9SAUR
MALQKSKYLLAKVIPQASPVGEMETYRGCFTCRIWQFGHWVEVTIGDRLPCLGGANFLLLAMPGRKMCSGSPCWKKGPRQNAVQIRYEQLWAGQVADALVDLAREAWRRRWALKDPEVRHPKRASKVLEKAESEFDELEGEKCFMSCSVFSSGREREMN